MIIDPNPKHCPRCELWYPRTAECFDVDKQSKSLLQSWCVECKDNWEHDPGNMFRRLREFLVKKEPRAWLAWDAMPGGAEVEFLRKLAAQDGVCRTCGAGLREWQRSGHNLDRIDNNDGNLHMPQNVVFACLPCNWTRGRKRWSSWLSLASQTVTKYGWGAVAWGEEDDRFNRVVWRKCRHLAVSPPPAPPHDPLQVSFCFHGGSGE